MVEIQGKIKRRLKGYPSPPGSLSDLWLNSGVDATPAGDDGEGGSSGSGADSDAGTDDDDPVSARRRRMEQLRTELAAIQRQIASVEVSVG